MLGLEPRRVDDVAVVGDVLDDRLDLLLGVAEAAQRARDRLVDDLHRAAADQLLELDQGQVGLDAGGVAVHHQADGAGRREHRGLRVAPARLLTDLDALLPLLGRLAGDRGRHRARRLDVVAGRGVLAHDPLVRLGVAGVAVVGADHAGHLGRTPVGGAGHQRGDRAGQRAPTVGVVGQAGRHQQRAEVGVADAELAVGAGGLADLLGREVGEADRDVHRRDDELDRLDEPLDLEATVGAEELHQVERRQVAGRVVEVQVLGARVGRGDPAGLGAGVPVVDRVVVLQARVGALPRGLRDRAEQLAGVDGLDHRAVEPARAGRTCRSPRPRA